MSWLTIGLIVVFVGVGLWAALRLKNRSAGDAGSPTPVPSKTIEPEEAPPPEMDVAPAEDEAAPEEEDVGASEPEETMVEDAAPEDEAEPPRPATAAPTARKPNTAAPSPSRPAAALPPSAPKGQPAMAPRMASPQPGAAPDVSPRPPEEIRPPEEPIPEDEQIAVQRIYFGTDRGIDDVDKKGPVFGHERARKLTVGCTDITIPKEAHALGHLERPKEIKIFSIRLWTQKEDPQKHFTIDKTQVLTPEEFTLWAGHTASKAKNYAGTAFLFIHGFNTDFSAAMFRAAQMAHDLNFDGPAFAYSWPSVGETLDYVTDMDSADGAALYIDEFLDLILKTPGVERLHLVAHSIGNAALAQFLSQAGTRLQARQTKPIDQMILAAPDLDAGEFGDIAKHFTKQANNITLYACANDRALLASQKIRKDYPRLGDVEDGVPVVIGGVDTIDVTSVGSEIFSLNHNVYAKNRSVLDDLGRLFSTGQRPPDKRMPTLVEVSTDKGPFWRMPE